MPGRFIAAFVASKADLIALVGDRVRPGQADPTDRGKDYLVYLQVDGQSVGALDGASGVRTGRWQVNVVSADPRRARRIARLLAGTGTVGGDPRLDGYRGTLGGVVVRSCRLVDERDAPGPPTHGERVGPWEVQQDYQIAWADSDTPVP